MFDYLKYWIIQISFVLIIAQNLCDFYTNLWNLISLWCAFFENHILYEGVMNVHNQPFSYWQNFINKKKLYKRWKIVGGFQCQN